MNQLDVCKKCSNCIECAAMIIHHPEVIVKCIHFGKLKEYISSIELPSELGVSNPFAIDEFNQCGCTSFIFTLGKENENG